jgi:hypothetical protein
MKPKCRDYFGDVNAPVGVWLLVGAGLAGPEGSDAGYIYVSTPPHPWSTHPPSQHRMTLYTQRERLVHPYKENTPLLWEIETKAKASRRERTPKLSYCDSCLHNT